MDALKRYTVEFMGTFFLVLTVCFVLINGIEGAAAALAIGLILSVMVYAGGYVSGGHYNPAVTLAVAIRGGMSFFDLIPYWISQALGALAASYSVLAITQSQRQTPECPFNMIEVLMGEFLFTFALAYVVLTSATEDETEGNSYYGFAIGGTVAAGILAVGGTLCYAAFNPAVALGIGIVEGFCPFTLMITALANLTAGALAAVIFMFTSNTQS